MYALNVIVLIPEKNLLQLLVFIMKILNLITSVKYKTYTKELNKVETIKKFQY